MSNTIAPEESRAFRRGRRVLAWMSAAVVVVILAGSSLPKVWPVALVNGILIGAYAIVMLPVLFWPCPRCGSLYSVRFWPIGISWPWVNQCLHCGAELVKEPSDTL
jgi:hypothetical protein